MGMGQDLLRLTKKNGGIGGLTPKKKHIDDISPKFDAYENFLETPGFE